MQITRRGLASVLAAVPALSQTSPPNTPGDLVQAARDRIKSNGDALAKVDVPMDVEPAFQFKA